MDSCLPPKGDSEGLQDVARILARGYLRVVLGQAGKSSTPPDSLNLSNALAESVNQSVHGLKPKRNGGQNA